MPKVLHYGLEWEIPGSGWRFDKHWFQNFDALACAPWDLAQDKPMQGLFQHPPHPASLSSKVRLAFLRVCLQYHLRISSQPCRQQSSTGRKQLAAASLRQTCVQHLPKL